MNCYEFHERLQRQLDARRSPNSDLELTQHAACCDTCANKLKAWEKVVQLISSPEVVPSPCETIPSKRWLVSGSFSRTLVAVATATVVLAVVFQGRESLPTTPPDSESNMALIQSPSAEERSEAFDEAVREIDPAYWWRQLREEDWVSRTMPTVRSVQQGVAPLGRTFMRAVTILTFGASEQTS